MFGDTKCLFNLSLVPNFQNLAQGSTLQVVSCSVLVDNIKKTPYSELQELNRCLINSNNGFGDVVVEVGFVNKFKNPYFKFWGNCVSIRADDSVICKIDGIFDDGISKVDKNGNVVIGVEYFFRDEDIRQKVLSCRSFCLEMFLALEKKNNVFALRCEFEKDSVWETTVADTYKYKAHIHKLRH